MKKALITGITGQDGAYLAKFLLNNGYRVFGLARKATNRSFDNLEYLGVKSKIKLIDGDLTDEVSLIKVVKKVKPDEVYNLAAQSFVGLSWKQPELTMKVNALGVLYLLEAIKNFSPKTKFYQASTSEIFGQSDKGGLRSEEAIFRPRSPYAIAKLYAYCLTNNYKESYGLFCCNGIMFNHESPLRGREFVTRKISEGVAKIKLGLAKEIKLGNLESKRDWGFAGDYVEAMWLMMQQKQPDNYLISTGQTHSVKDFVKEAFKCVGIKNWAQYVKIDLAFKRPSELYVLQGKSDKALKILGWKPKVKFAELVAIMVKSDLKKLSGKKA